MLRISLKRSYIGSPEKMRSVLRSLGLRKVGMTKTHKDNEAVRGMIYKVSHLVSVEKVDQ